ncbi:type IV-A pilus assembly ATPase PilB [bacterium]|nr:type IV-A pilus assembly ATPase PilB [bacterium]
MNERQLAGMLVKKGIISLPELRNMEQSLVAGEKLKELLLKENKISENDLLDIISEQYNVPKIVLRELDIDQEIIEILPKRIVLRHNVIPVSRIGNTLTVAMIDPSDMNAQDDIKFLTDYNIEVVVAAEADIKETIAKYYEAKGNKATGFGDITTSIEDLLDEVNDVSVRGDGDDDDELTLEDTIRDSEDAPVVKLVNMIMLDAIKKDASDIHVEPYETSFRVRLRIDGVLYDTIHPPRHMMDAITARLKVMASLDIAEKRVPQDGRIKIKLGKGRDMDFRVSVCPVIFGEKVVLRLLDKSNLQLDMTKLGFYPYQIDIFKEAIYKPYGMVLVTGPTGSGKTTTLYSALSDLNKEDVNISTAEDPVEFNLEGINQVPVREQVGLNFAAALRSFLRQDPDIIMVGEIRDFETAEIAVKAALTGHLVLSTLHTNDAPATITRLLNMGIESFLLTSSLNVVLAQRLGRRICAKCKEEIDVEPEKLISLGISPADLDEEYHIYKGRGCDVCNGTGYKGRVAFYEIMKMDDTVKEAVLNGASAMELKEMAMAAGFKTMRMNANERLLEGVTTIDEVTRNTAPDN